MDELVPALERPLPKPSAEEYASVRVLEALVESKLALDFLEKGLVRNAAGKAFQAWRAVLAALLRLELDRFKALAKSEEERRWLEEKAVPRVPTTRIVMLSQRLRELGYGDISYITSQALNLHDYQYHGPDPDMALSKYRSREEAAVAVRELVEAVAEYAERLKAKAKWTEDHERALEAVKKALGPRETVRGLT
ncbi:MAG: PaREP1 family protein [Thermoproteus sp.]